MKLDILVIVAHPDDAELYCGGTMIKHVDLGYKVGLIDLTRGELGTRGGVFVRAQESAAAADALELSIRDNLGFADGFFRNDESHQKQLVRKIRQYQPEIIITHPDTDRHPDHGRAAELVKTSAFLAGLQKVETRKGTETQPIWRTKQLFQFVQYDHVEPDFVVDISGYADRKMAAVKAHKTQFYNPESDEPETFIAQETFLEFIRSRDINTGARAQLFMAEGFTTAKKPAIDHLFTLK